MVMLKELNCLHCKKSISPSAGFQHDVNLNLICSHCGKIIFAVTDVDEETLKKTLISYNGTKKEPLPIKLTDIAIDEFFCFL